MNCYIVMCNDLIQCVYLNADDATRYADMLRATCEAHGDDVDVWIEEAPLNP